MFQGVVRLFAVVRLPVLMEDEGRYHLLKVFSDRDAAEAYIRAYTADGYFKLGDLVIMEGEGPCAPGR